MDPVTAIGLAAVVQQLLFCLGQTLIKLDKYYSDFKDAGEETRRLRNELDTSIVLITRVWVAIEDIDEEVKAPLDKTARDFVNKLEQFSKLIHPSQVKGIKRFIWPLKKDETEKMTTQILGFQSTFHLALDLYKSAYISEKVDDIQLDVRDFRKEYQISSARARKGAILEWLYASDTIDSKQETLRRTRASNSGVWFLNNSAFQTWKEGKASSPILFCPGIPGAGKSVLASVVIDHLNDEVSVTERTGIAYAYFDYNERSVQSWKDLLSRLLRQLASHIDSLPSALEAAYDTGKKPDAEILLPILKIVSNQLSSVFIILDGFDECADDFQTDIIHMISEIQTPTVRLLITSRPQVQNIFKLNPTVLQIRADSNDVHNYVSQRLAHIKSPTLRGKIFERLTQKECDMFLLIKLQVDHVLLPKNKSPKKMKADLENIPNGLTELYTNVMDRIETNGVKEVATSILSWLYFTPVPMNIKEIQVAIAIEDGECQVEEDDLFEPEQLIEFCQGLITCENVTGIVQFTHYTVRDFLEYYKGRLLTKLSLAKILLQSLVGEISETAETFRSPMQTFRYYTLEHWGHYTRGDGEASQEIRRILFNTTTIKVLLQWVFQPGTTLLHVFASQGFEILCQLAIDEGEIWPNFQAKGHDILPARENSGIGEDDGCQWIFVGNLSSKKSMMETPLHVAAMHGHAGVVSIMLRAGADVHAQSALGNIMDYALRSKSSETIEIIGNHMSIQKLTADILPARIGLRKSLLIGVNYFGTAQELKGCIGDIRNMALFLNQRHSFSYSDMVILTDDQRDPISQPTRAIIIRALHWLVAGVQSGDSLFFHFSGHAGKTKNLDACDEEILEQVIYPVDFRKSGFLVGEVRPFLVKDLPVGCRLTAIFDSSDTSSSPLCLFYAYEPELRISYPSFKGSGSGDIFQFSISEPKKDSRTMSWAFREALTRDPHQNYLSFLQHTKDITASKPVLFTNHPIDIKSPFTL